MSDHQVRARSFGAVADAYERGRPHYPPAAIAWVLGTHPLDVVDLGAGTGKLTAALVAAGHRVVAVEPLPEMSAHLSARLPGVEIRAARAEETGLAAHAFDAVVAGSAFHWFDRERVLPEIERLLRPGGLLGLLGNGFDQTVPWVASLAAAIGGGHGSGRAWPDEAELAPAFTAVEDAAFPFSEPVDRGRLEDVVASRSSVATLPEDQRRRVFARLDGLWGEEPALRGRTRVPLPYLTRARRARLRL